MHALNTDGNPSSMTHFLYIKDVKEGGLSKITLGVWLR